MKKLLSSLILAAAVLSVIGILVIPGIFAEGEEAETVADTLLERTDGVEEVQTPNGQEEIDACLLAEQAAARDAERFKKYLSEHCEDEIWHHFAGLYLNEEDKLVIMFSCELENSQTSCGCKEILQQVGFETNIVIEGCKGSYYEVMGVKSEIGQKVAEMNQKVKAGKGTEKEIELDSHRPAVIYMDPSNSILVRIAAASSEEFESAVKLFKEVIGDYEAVFFERKIPEDELLMN